ncbi:MAG TPA: hypothetical protein VHD15_01810 [Hyphomicrobiales bacterium]|nr:hypothetical protein [Hyphomicrobiales bacterium]
MLGATLSRWTMSYFAAALVFLFAAEALMAAGYGFPAAPVAAPATLVLVHVVALGWLSLLMCGALFQFVPVLVARPLYSDRLPLPALGLLLGGIAALLCAFVRLGGGIDADLPFFPAAACLLGAGFSLVIWNLGLTLWRARPLPLPARFVAVGLASLAATVAFGIVFALVFGGATSFAPFLAFAGGGLPLHVVAGLGGWLTLTAIGVSYRLLAMFMLAPELDRATTRGALRLAAAALAVAILGGTLAIAIGTDLGLRAALGAAWLLGFAGLVLYGRDAVRLYEERKRPKIELNSHMAAFALASLAAAAALAVGLLAVGALQRHAAAVVFLAAFGWLSGLALAKLYKIVAFLTWLESYGPVLGKAPTPRVQDLVAEARAVPWFRLYFAAVWFASACLLAGQPVAFRAGAGLMLVATAAIVAQLVRTRRLDEVEAARRLPQGVRRPRLLFSSVQRAWRPS